MNMTKPEDSTSKPNIVIIMTDQHRADLMTCAGSDLVPTPNMDGIASRGVRFQNAYCPYPVCVASRMSLLTGLYSHSTGAIDNTDQLDWRYRTVANHFSENGYLTALIGKMHFNNAHSYGFSYYMSINDWLMYLGPKVRHYANEIASHPHGMHFFKTVYDTGAGFPDMERLWEGDRSPWVGNVERYSFDSMASHLEAEDHLDSFIARESVKFLRQYRDQRFFLVTSFMKPHTPFFPPREWAEKYPVDEIELPPIGDISTYPPHIQNRIRNYVNTEDKYLRAGRAGYLGNLAFVDTCVGEVYSELGRLGLIDNTIVVYTSDHGEMDGDHGLYQKFCLFEPSVRVPLIVSWPGHIPEDRVTEALTEYFGIYPTLAELTDTPMAQETTLINIPGSPESIDSDSFANVLRNPDLAGPSAVFCEYALKSAIPQYMIRTHRYKYNFNHGTMHELYDLEADPGEYVNLVNNPGMKKISGDLRNQLIAWYDPERNPYRNHRTG